MDQLQEFRFEIEGILIAPREFSYLRTFAAPKFDSNTMEFIRLKPGLNVVFGRNGSGKTSLLKMLDAAAAGRCSPFEGLVIKLSEGFVRDKIEHYSNVSRYFGGKIPRNSGGLFLQDGWQFNYSSEVLKEWAKTRLALVSPSYMSSLFAEDSPAAHIGSDKGHHEYIYTSLGKVVNLQITPLISVNEDTPNTKNEIEAFKRYCANVFEINKGGTLPDISDEEKERVPLSLIANNRNYLGSDYRTVPNDKSQLWFLDSLPGGFSTYPDTGDFERERYSAPEPFISAIADGFVSSNNGFALESTPNLLKIIANKGLKRAARNNIAVSIATDTSSILVESVKTAIEKVSKSFEKAFPIFRSSYVPKFSDHGLMMGLDPSVVFTDTGAFDGQLSESESRWFQLGLATQNKEPSLLLLDEPERGLDRNALREIVGKLTSDWLANSVIVAASHSPSLLGVSNSNAILIKDQELIPYSRSELNNLKAYGIGPTDLVELHKAFIFVEGEHDKIIFEHFFESELSELGATLIPVLGVGKMSHLPDWSFFMRCTEAPLFMVVDNMPNEELIPAYLHAREIFALDGYDSAVTYLKNELNPNGEGNEAAAVVRVLGEAMKLPDPSRFIPCSVTKKDILWYLPPTVFGLNAPWEDLYVEFERTREPKGDDFKSWIRRTKRIDIKSANSIRQALRKHDLPADSELSQLIDAIGSQIAKWKSQQGL